MFKPRTVSQYKIHRFLKERFYLEHCLVSPLSRSALLLEDQNGMQMAFVWKDGSVQPAKTPAPPDADTVRAFWKQLKEHPPRLKDYEEITAWWLNHPNPLTYQMALGLPDDLYRHFLTHEVLEDEAVYQLAAKKTVTESEFLDICLWYHNGHFRNHWFGQTGLDGTGDIYCLTRHYGTADAREMEFYLINDYYRYMKQISEQNQ